MSRRGVEPHLARLRRHARAMAGSQSSGDAYVTALLDIINADASILHDPRCPRVGLFRLYSQLVATTSRDTGESGPADLRQLPAPAMLPHQIREALLLMSVERFSIGEVAEIMGVAPPEVQALVDAAGESLAALGGAEVMIIESEPLIAMNIKQIVEDLGLRVNSMPPTHGRALPMLHHHTPDLIIADGGSHLAVVEDLYTAGKPPVIFISAYPEMVLTGSRPEPVFVAAKPFDPAEIKALIFQALFFADLDWDKA
ncbi:response regulator [Niveispirillum cyanobacteriorum]|nr:response regulator [Niveispirillum cyanobacteriorum]GGE78750.1 response regulator [Niveispirillum cyanobacteriorum]